MNREQAQARLLVYCPVAVEPVLDSGDISVLLDLSKMVDVDGIEPSETGWAETYDVNFTIAQAWLVKATRLADRYLFMVGGKMFSRHQYFDHCMTLSKKFLMKSPIRAVRLGPGKVNPLDMIPLYNDTLVPNNWNANV